MAARHRTPLHAPYVVVVVVVTVVSCGSRLPLTLLLSAFPTLPLAGGFTNLIWAVGNTISLAKHQSVNFVTGESHAIAAPPLQVTHGVLMCVAWGVLLPIGIMLARFTKHLPKPEVCDRSRGMGGAWLMSKLGLVLSAVVCARFGFLFG